MTFDSDCLLKTCDGFSALTIGVLGDFCLDVYWHADMTCSQLSRETPNFPLPITEESMRLGGAGNVAQNLVALGVGKILPLTVYGRDWRGWVLERKMREQGMNIDTVVSTAECWTNAYIKPVRHGISDVAYEDARLDFENRKALSQQDEEALIARLDQAVLSLDALCVCDQLQFGCVTPALRERIIHYGRQGLLVVADSRDRIGCYTDVIVKPNDVEACRALGQTLHQAAEKLETMALELEKQTSRPAVITCGEQGCLYAREGRIGHVPAFAAEPPIDICGAGDTFMAAMVACLASGVELETALLIANLASSVVVKKLNQTGTANRAELLERWKRTARQSL